MKKRAHVFLSLLLICISASLLGFFISSMRHAAKNEADVLAREELNIDVGIFAKQDIPERLIPELIEPSGKGENLIYGFDEDEQYRLNRFLTYFSEQLFSYYDPADSDALVNFAYQYIRINRGNFEALAADGLLDTVEGALVTEGSNYEVSADTIDAITERFFGYTIPHTEDTYYFGNTRAGEYSFLNVATAVYANADDTYTVEFDTYSYSIMARVTPCPFREEDLISAEKRSDWTQEDSRLFSYFAETLEQGLRWEYLGTTSGEINPNPYSYLGYDIYAIEYYTSFLYGESFLYFVPYGGSAPTPVIYAYAETDHAMYPVFYNGSFVCGEYLSLSGPSARVHPELQYRKSGTAVVRSYGEGAVSSYQLLSYDNGNVSNRPTIPLDADLQYRLNRFMSYFSEQSFGVYNADQTGNTDALLTFAYSYLRINEPDVLEPAQDGTSRIMLRADDVDRVVYRFFGTTVEHTEDVYYFPVADEDTQTFFSTVEAISENGDGTYRVEFTKWELSSGGNRYSTVPDECYSLNNLTVYDSKYSSDISFESYGTAVIREYTDGDNTTYQLISYVPW